MLAVVLLGVALNLSTIVINSLLYHALHTGHIGHLKWTIPFVLGSLGSAVGLGVLFYRGLSSSEFHAFALSFLPLTLGAPLIPLWMRDIRCTRMPNYRNQ